jgi:hypothetical protein
MRARRIAAAVLPARLAACGESGASRTGPPSGLTCSTSPAVHVVGTAIAPNVPTRGGGVVESRSVAPALPAGLSLDVATGTITGNPTATAAPAS